VTSASDAGSRVWQSRRVIKAIKSNQWLASSTEQQEAGNECEVTISNAMVSNIWDG